MRLKGYRISERYSQAKAKPRGERLRRVEETETKIAKAWLQASSPAGMPQPLDKPSNTRPFRRARIDDDLRLYWWIDAEILVFHDIAEHGRASKYRDVHD